MHSDKQGSIYKAVRGGGREGNIVCRKAQHSVLSHTSRQNRIPGELVKLPPVSTNSTSYSRHSHSGAPENDPSSTLPQQKPSLKETGNKAINNVPCKESSQMAARL